MSPRRYRREFKININGSGVRAPPVGPGVRPRPKLEVGSGAGTRPSAVGVYRAIFAPEVRPAGAPPTGAPPLRPHHAYNVMIMTLYGAALDARFTEFILV